MDCDVKVSQLMTYDAALAHLLSQAKPVQGHERVSVFDINQRVLAEDLCAPIDLPPYPNSAMDGYAIAQVEHQLEYTVVGTALAGHPAQQSLQSGEAIRIMTGALLPEGATTVVMQEYVTREQDRIRLSDNPRAGACIRWQGEDIQQGQRIFEKGTLLSARDAALLSACGFGDVLVYCKVNVALFSTGDELVVPGQPLKAGQLYDSNRPLLNNLLKALQVNVSDLGILPDEPAAIRQALTDAAQHHDVILTSGGVSVGEADFIKQILDELGQVNFWKVAMKPGKPIAFGFLGRCAFLGLPGNPVSSAVTFDQLATPFLRTMQRQPEVRPKTQQARTTTAFKKQRGRLDFQRGIATADHDGQWRVASAGKQGSAMLAALSQANCYVMLPAESDGVAEGETVQIVLIRN